MTNATYYAMKVMNGGRQFFSWNGQDDFETAEQLDQAIAEWCKKMTLRMVEQTRFERWKEDGEIRFRI